MKMTKRNEIPTEIDVQLELLVHRRTEAEEASLMFTVRGKHRTNEAVHGCLIELFHASKGEAEVLAKKYSRNWFTAERSRRRAAELASRPPEPGPLWWKRKATGTDGK
jgi:hypothetical protein